MENKSKTKLKKLEIVNQLNEIFVELFLHFRNKANINSYSKKKIRNSHNNKIMLCSIGKNENLYAKEFVEYYISLGFDKIIILDNNDLNGDRFEEILKNYVDKKLVEIKDLRGLKYIQILSFNYCYRKYKYIFDWIAFFDFDEFLYIKNNTNIKKYLYSNKFNKCQQILFHWHIYNDNDLLRYENKTMIKRFTQLRYLDTRTKFIVRGNLENLLIPSSHIAINTNYCNSKGEKIFPKSFNLSTMEKDSIAYIKHFYTKTAEEYCQKRKRGYAQSLSKQSINLTKNEINLFFQYNKMTFEKMKTLYKLEK